MKLTPEGIKLLKSLEGSVKRGGRHVVYDDATGAPFDEDRPVGQATIGHGHLLVDSEVWPDGLSEEGATALLKRDLIRFEKTVDSLITAPIEPHERDAFVILSFNIGCAGLKRASAVKAFNEGRKGEVSARIKLWNKARLADGSLVVSNGLKRRREVEAMLFANGFDAAWKAWRS